MGQREIGAARNAKALIFFQTYIVEKFMIRSRSVEHEEKKNK